MSVPLRVSSRKGKITDESPGTESVTASTVDKDESPGSDSIFERESMTQMMRLMESMSTEADKDREERRIERERDRADRREKDEQGRLERVAAEERYRLERQEERELQREERKSHREKEEQLRLERQQERELQREKEEQNRLERQQEREQKKEERIAKEERDRLERQREVELQRERDQSIQQQTVLAEEKWLRQIREAEDVRAAQADSNARIRAEEVKRKEEDKKLKALREAPKMAPLKDVEDLEVFLGVFGEHMRRCDVAKEHWVTALVPLLDPSSLGYYNGYQDDQKQDFEKLCANLAESHGLDEDHYRLRWKDLKREPSESYQHLAQRVSSLCDRWSQKAKTVQEVREMIEIDKILDLMPAATRSWVRRCRPRKLHEAGRIADQFEVDVPKEKEPARFQHYARAARGSADRPGFRPAVEPERRKEEKPSEQITPKPPAPVKMERGPKCYRCQGMGHIAANCSTPVSQALITTAAVFPDAVYEGSINGRRAESMMRDSLCNMTHVHPRMLPQGYKSEGRVLVKGHDDRTVPYPSKTVEIRIGNLTATVKAVVNRNLSCDMLLGTDIPGIERLGRRQRTTRGRAKRSKPRRGASRRCKKQTSYREQSTESESGSSSSVGTSRGSSESEQVGSDGGSSSNQTQTESESEEVATSESEAPSTGTGPSGDENEKERDLPEFDDDLFLETASQSRLTRNQKRTQAGRFGGLPILDGGAAQLREAQVKDKTLQHAWRKADSRDSLFFTKNGLLHRRHTLTDQEESLEQLVLPREYRETALRTAHSSPLAGHFGRKKTYSKLSARFFWPEITKDVKELCRTCQICQRTATGRSPRYPLVSMPVVDKPFSRVAMDMVGPLPGTTEGFRYILTIVDYGTRFPEAVPLKSTSSQDVADALLGVFARVGIPNELLTDRGANFCGELMVHLQRMLGIAPLKTSAYHPQTDGMVERYNSTLKSGLRKYVEKFRGEWDKAIPLLLFAYREVPCETTGFSPFELLYGRNPRGPLDILKEEWEVPSTKKESVVGYLLDVYRKLEEAKEVASRVESRKKEKTKVWYDRTARARKFEIGDLVLILIP